MSDEGLHQADRFARHQVAILDTSPGLRHSPSEPALILPITHECREYCWAIA